MALLFQMHVNPCCIVWHCKGCRGAEYSDLRVSTHQSPNTARLALWYAAVQMPCSMGPWFP